MIQGATTLSTKKEVVHFGYELIMYIYALSRLSLQPIFTIANGAIAERRILHNGVSSLVWKGKGRSARACARRTQVGISYVRRSDELCACLTWLLPFMHVIVVYAAARQMACCSEMAGR